MNKITIKDVAEKSGVSANTVSRVLNNKPEVSTETREKVLEVVQKLNYRPNRVAQRLRSNKTGVIGVIVTDITNPFFSAVVKGIERGAKDHNYSIILQDTAEDYQNEEEAIEIMLAEQVDGLLIAPVQDRKDTIAELNESNFPFVLLARRFYDLATDYIVTDDVQGGFLATEHLLNQGHERIAIINGPRYISNARERLDGYKKALKKHGINLNESLVKANAITMEDGYIQAQRLLDSASPPTAVFTYSDFVGLGVMKAAWERGVCIPENIAVVGYDDIMFSSCSKVPLTSVNVPKEALGEKAVSALIEKIISKKHTSIQIKLDVSLNIRQSSFLKIGGDI